MLNKKTLKMSMIFLVLITSSAFASGGQKKSTSSPAPPPPPRPAAPARPAPQAQPRSNPSVNRNNTGGVNRTPTGGVTPGSRPGTGVGVSNRPAIGNTGGYRPPTPGTHTVMTRSGGQMEMGANNKPTHFVGKDGQEAKFGSKGQITQIHDPKHNMTIEHGARPGERRVVTEQNGRRLVSTGAHSGYMERPYLNRNGHTYYQRTYWRDGHAYARAYRGYYYGGVRYYGYAPAFYYHPAFYGWAYSPWGAPVYYGWGWGAAPWFYGGYFAPAPFYGSASLWLTDYLLAEDLKQDYDAKQEAQARAQTENQGSPENGDQNTTAAPLSPQVKQMIDAEVQQQLAQENAAAQSQGNGPAPVGNEAPPPALDPKQRLFVVADSLSVATADGQECGLTAGDVLTRIDDSPNGDNKVRVSVMSSKPNDCTMGMMPLVAVNDLQEMHNSFQAQLDTGLQTLAQKSGTGGLPKAPDAQTVPGEVPPPSPDGNVDAKLAEQQNQATQTEAEVRQEVPPAN